MAWSNSRPHVPPLFQAIIENHNARRALTSGRVVEFHVAHQVRALQKRMGELRRAAEVALSWNKDKGKTK